MWVCGWNARNRRSSTQLQSLHLEKLTHRMYTVERRKESTCLFFSYSMATSGMFGWTWWLLYFIIIITTLIHRRKYEKFSVWEKYTAFLNGKGTSWTFNGEKYTKYQRKKRRAKRIWIRSTCSSNSLENCPHIESGSFVSFYVYMYKKNVHNIITCFQ